MLGVYACTIFLAAFLLFGIQPMAAKMILPLLGGSPSVWNAAMLFFQTALLTGYTYAHCVGALRPRFQVALHMTIFAAGLLALPIGLREWSLNPSPDTPHALSAIVMLGASVGIPAIILCSASPLLSRWFAMSRHIRSSSPYFLYAASNAGSMLGLLSYPVAIEPLFTLTQQRHAWSLAYAVLLLLFLVCGTIVWRRNRAAQPFDARPDLVLEPPLPAGARWRERAWWALLAMIPASLTMAATQYITTDIASVPFLWVVPLSIYLLTYIIAFSGWNSRAALVASRALPFMALAVCTLLAAGVSSPFALMIPAHLLLLLVAALACHGRLSSERPHPSRLTEFYFFIALGGVAAGIFNTLIAPAVFDSVAEYPIMIVAACLCRGWMPHDRWAGLPKRKQTANWLSAWIVVLLVPAMLLIVERRWLGTGLLSLPMLKSVKWVVPMLATGSLLRLRFHFAAALALLAGFPFVSPWPDITLLYNERTFFGVHRVTQQSRNGLTFNEYLHGRTIHGVQRIDPDTTQEPLSYYSRIGPLGQIISAMEERGGFERFGAVGLGTGAAAAYGRPGLGITFFEIDPTVARIARDPALFTYLRDSRSEIDIVIGDARLTLSAQPEGTFDLLLLDAFSSDAIPTHLLTREALAVYLRALRQDGVIAWHISNRYLDLRPVVARLAEEAGLVGLTLIHEPASEDELRGVAASEYIALARSAEAFGTLNDDRKWRALRSGPGGRTWTDDYCDLLGAMNRR